MMRVWLVGLAMAAAWLAGAGVAAAGPRQVTFYYAPDVLAPAEWTQVQTVLNQQFATERAQVRRDGAEMLEDRTTVARADIDFDGIDELFVMLYGPEVVCFEYDGCLTAILRRDREGDPWRYDSAPVSILSVGPPKFYLREEVFNGRRTFFSSADPMVAEPAADERVRFQRGGASLSASDWQAIMGEINRLGRQRGVAVSAPADVDVARVDMHPNGGDEVIVTVRNACQQQRCPAAVFFENAGTWRFATSAPIDDVFIGADDLPILFVRDERSFGWRSTYTSRGEPRRRVPFTDWGRYGMTLPVLADIAYVDRIERTWGGGDGPRSGTEFLANRTFQDKALDKWVDEVADPFIRDLTFATNEGRIVTWGSQRFAVTRDGLRGALLAEGVVPVITFFGMLARRNYTIDESDYPPVLRASMHVIALRLRDTPGAAR